MKQSQAINIFWFRRDLRLDDNIGLFHALNSATPVLPIFVFDKQILKKFKDKDDQRILFIWHTLKQMKEELQESGHDLLVIHDDIEQAWDDLIKKYNINEVYFNEDYEPKAIKRDNKIQTKLKKAGIESYSYKDQCIFAKNDVLKKDGKPYTVYTPYKNKWLENLTPAHIASYKCKKLHDNFIETKASKLPSLNDLGRNSNEVFKINRRIKKKVIQEYHLNRDIPSINGTSLMGVHLRFGTISVRKCVQIAYELNKTWLSELIWREFFMQILYHFPHVETKSFKEKYDKIQWRNNKTEFQKWCEGKTGYPIVDAGIRELNETGHMHNRVRMIVASFLIKDLLIDWRWGEKYFAEKLLDFDLSANNGNWQWVAGSGCDAAPYFRIFNPHTQLKKFDPDYKYVKKWVPEYGTPEYVDEMIDHNEAYHRALEAYKSALN